jgi:hypothetical protein
MAETPQQASARRKKIVAQETQQRTDISLAKQAITQTEKVKGNTSFSNQERLNNLILKKALSLSTFALPTLTKIANDLGIADITNPTLPPVCPPQETLDRVLTIRNNVNNQLTVLSKYLKVTEVGLDSLQKLTQGAITLVEFLTITRTTTSLAAKFLPTLPGAVGSTLSDLEAFKNLITFDSLGNPKLAKTKVNLSQGLVYLAKASAAILQLLAVIKSIDLVLVHCGKNPESIDTDTESIALITSQTQAATNSILTEGYKGFTLTIEEKQYTPTTKQIRAVANNSQGITLLTTPYSFSTQPELLISELKFKIDSENLKPF